MIENHGHAGFFRDWNFETKENGTWE